MKNTQVATTIAITAQDGAVNVVQARIEARQLALQLGFPAPRVQMATTIVEELARNIIAHARTGTIELGLCFINRLHGISIIARDDGPGIANIELALLCGYSTSGGLGYGLTALSRMADELEIISEPGGGTVVRAVLLMQESL